MTDTTLLKYSIVNPADGESFGYDPNQELWRRHNVIKFDLVGAQEEAEWNMDDKSLFKLLYHKTTHWKFLCDFGKKEAEIPYLYRRFDVMNQNDPVMSVWLAVTGIYDYNPVGRKFTPMHLNYSNEGASLIIDEIDARISCYERQQPYEKEFTAPFNPATERIFTSGIDDPVCPAWLQPRRKRGTKKEWIWQIK